MPLKKKGSLQTLQRETEAIQRRLDESASVGNYDQHKRDEVEGLWALQDRLRALSLQLQDRDVGPSSNDAEEDSIGEKDEESQEDEDEEEDDDDAAKNRAASDEGADGARVPAEGVPGSYVVLSAFAGDEEGDLSVQKGDVLRVLQKNEDGWWLVQDSDSNRGLVPRNYLRLISSHEQEKQSEDEESDEEWEAENEPLDVQPSTSSDWDSVRKTVTEMDATDVLSAMGAIPPGFRTSTLSRLLEEGVCRALSTLTSTQHTGAAVSLGGPSLGGSTFLERWRPC